MMADAQIELDREFDVADVYLARPDIMEVTMAFMDGLKANRRLSDRLVELLRLRIAFHNQCRYCMSVRYGEGIDDGLDENLVCSLERPADAPDMSDAEKAAVAFADRFATNHLSLTVDRLAELGRYFTTGEITEIATLCASFVGFGRMRAVFDAGEALPVGARAGDAPLTPWGIEQPIILR